MGDGVSWPAGADEVIKGDLTAAAAYLTPAGGAVVTGVAPCGIEDRDPGVLGYTTSLGFGKKLERIVADPHVALAFHAREHGFSASPAFVLAQGTASVDLTPSRQRLEALTPQVERYMGEVKRGVVWDRLLREYYAERVFVDIAVGAHRRLAGPERFRGHAGDRRCLARSRRPAAAAARRHRPAHGRGQGRRADRQRPHRVLAYRGADGFPGGGAGADRRA